MPTVELLTPGQLAARLSVSAGTVTRWRRQGLIPSIRINSTVYRFDLGEVLSTLKARSTNGVGLVSQPVKVPA